MDIRTLNYFKTVAELEHISNAARKLKIAQPALTRSIHHLEEELGYPLFEREKNRIYLNDNGKLFFDAASQILMILDNAKLKLQEQNQNRELQITIAIRSASSILSQPISSFMRSHPEISFRFVNEAEGAMPDHADFLLYSSASFSKNRQEYLLWTEPLFVAVNPKHPIAGLKSVALSQLKTEDFILLDDRNDLYWIAMEYFRRAGFSPRIAATSEKPNIIQNLLFENAGITILPGSMQSSREFSDLRFLPISDMACFRYIYLIPKPNRHLTAVMKEFQASIFEFYRKEG